jgi:hypothetical protein
MTKCGHCGQAGHNIKICNDPYLHAIYLQILQRVNELYFIQNMPYEVTETQIRRMILNNGNQLKLPTVKAIVYLKNIRQYPIPPQVPVYNPYELLINKMIDDLTLTRRTHNIEIPKKSKIEKTSIPIIYSSKQIIKEQYECPICLDRKTPEECVILNPCNHHYCIECIETYLQKYNDLYHHPSCACCRTKIENIVVEPNCCTNINNIQFEIYG